MASPVKFLDPRTDPKEQANRAATRLTPARRLGAMSRTKRSGACVSIHRVREAALDDPALSALNSGTCQKTPSRLIQSD